MAEEKEYLVHILNWPISATSMEEAARKAYQELKDNLYPPCFVFTVTEEIETFPEKIVREDFDSELWEQDENTSSDYDGSWPALNDAIEAIKEHEEKSKESEDEDWHDLYWTSFKPYEPLPRDENDEPYFPPSVGIVHANYEVRLPNEKRLQFFDEEDKDDKERTD